MSATSRPDGPDAGAQFDRALARSAAALRGASDTREALRAVVESIATTLEYRTALVQVFVPAWDHFEPAVIYGNAAADPAVGQPLPAREVEQLIAQATLRRGCYWGEDVRTVDGLPSHIPDTPRSAAPDRWQPESYLLVPLRAVRGEVIGLLWVDEPASGRRPGDAELDLLAAVATQAGLVLEASLAADEDSRSQLAMQELLRLTGQLATVDSHAAIAAAAAASIAGALGFERVAVFLDDGAGTAAPMAARGLDATQLPPRLPELTVATLGRLEQPDHGCVLLTRDAAAEIPTLELDLASCHNAPGGAGWNDHLLVAVVRDDAGAPAGLVWVSDPTDRRVPTVDELRTLRAFANQIGHAIDSFDADSRLRHSVRQAIDESRSDRERAESAGQAKAEFLSRISHELRTPLHAVLGFGQLLALGNLDAAAYEESVERILRAGEHLTGLIDELLEVGQIESGTERVSVGPLDGEALIGEVVELVDPLLDRYQVQLLRPAPSSERRFVLADGQRLRQILINLIGNAAKYNRPGGTVTVSLASAGELTQFVVADTGRGIAESDAHDIFLPFERGAGARNAVEGTGLGLAVSHRLARAMGGSLRLEHSELDRGSTFVLELPSAAPVAAVEPTRPSAAALGQSSQPWQLGPITLAYVDDDPGNLELMQLIVGQSAGTTLHCATDGAEMLALLERMTPDAILLDLHLGDIDGSELLAIFKARPALASVPVIVLSADAQPATIERLRRLGAADFVVKPIAIDAFVGAVARALGRDP
jgi:signal transduction histidine kinase/CheY-like chemotaxis protein